MCYTSDYVVIVCGLVVDQLATKLRVMYRSIKAQSLVICKVYISKTRSRMLSKSRRRRVLDVDDEIARDCRSERTE